MQRSTRRGMSLIELTVAMAISAIVLSTIGFVLVMMTNGFNEMEDFGNATGRVDMIRLLTFDARTGDSMLFPTTNGANGAYTDGSANGHRVRFRAIEYNPTTESSTPVFIQWESRRTGNTGPYVVSRWRMVDANNNNIDDDGSYTQTFGESPVQVFTIQRVNRQNFNIEMETTEGNETAHVQLAVTLRNVQ